MAFEVSRLVARVGHRRRHRRLRVGGRAAEHVLHARQRVLRALPPCLGRAQAARRGCHAAAVLPRPLQDGAVPQPLLARCDVVQVLLHLRAR